MGQEGVMDLLTKALIAQLAYEKSRDVITKRMVELLGPGEIEFIYEPKTDSEAHVYKYGDNQCIIAFAGTESWKDVSHDLFFLPNHYKGEGYIHSGFLRAIRGCKPAMNEAIKKLFPIGLINHMDYVGHSLGASMAILSVDEVDAITLSDEVTAFAPPNGFSRGARKYLENQYKFHNVVNNMDPVCMAMGITSGRPETQRTNLKGQWGHSIEKYIMAIQQGKIK